VNPAQDAVPHQLIASEQSEPLQGDAEDRAPHQGTGQHQEDIPKAHAPRLLHDAVPPVASVTQDSTAVATPGTSNSHYVQIAGALDAVREARHTLETTRDIDPTLGQLLDILSARGRGMTAVHQRLIQSEQALLAVLGPPPEGQG
jgi:hypothetical protein